MWHPIRLPQSNWRLTGEAKKELKLDSCAVNCSLPQLKHCFIFWSALARFDFGQGFSLVHGARGCVCNRGITCSERLVEKAICTDTDQMGAFPLNSAARLAFCIPLVTWLLTVTFSSVQVCLTLSDADGWTWPPLVAWFLGGEAGWGGFLSSRSRTGAEHWLFRVVQALGMTLILCQKLTVHDNWKLKLWDYSLPLFLILLLAIVSCRGSQKAEVVGEEI